MALSGIALAADSDSELSSEKRAAFLPSVSKRNILAPLVGQVAQVRELFYNLYLITMDDTPTFVVPNTVFGVASAFTSSLVEAADGMAVRPFPSSWMLCYALLQTILFNWTNLLIFDLANQRECGEEDVHNKHWRPIPSGRMTPAQMRHLLMLAIPVVLAYNHFILGVGAESCLLAILTWLYNDLGGGDDNWLIRNLIIGCAFGFYNMGSLKVAVSSSVVGSERARDLVSPMGYAWTTIISLLIFSTMHVQDLKDVKGDSARGRRSAPIVLGRRMAGWTIAIPVVCWSAFCPMFWWSPAWIGCIPAVLGGCVAWRCVCICGQWNDRRTWQLWCAWTAVLYMLPPLSA